MSAPRPHFIPLAVAAGLCLLTAAGPSPAQPQPAPSNADLEKRLRSLEEKLDHLLGKRENVDPVPAITVVSDGTLAALVAARDKAQAELEAKQRSFAEFRQRYRVLLAEPLELMRKISVQRLAD